MCCRKECSREQRAAGRACHTCQPGRGPGSQVLTCSQACAPTRCPPTLQQLQEQGEGAGVVQPGHHLQVRSARGSALGQAGARPPGRRVPWCIKKVAKWRCAAEGRARCSCPCSWLCPFSRCCLPRRPETSWAAGASSGTRPCAPRSAAQPGSTGAPGNRSPGCCATQSAHTASPARARACPPPAGSGT